MKKSFTLSPALALAHAGPTLAIHPAAIGRAFSLMEEDEPVGEVTAPTIGNVAIMHVRGPLSQRTASHMCGVSLGYDSIAEGFARILSEPSVGAVVLVIDSPGGAVPGLFTCVERMTAARDLAKKPVFAFADEMICSAAYAIATVATGGIFLPSSGEVGSVGVLTIHCDESQAQEGRVYTIVKSGPRKAEGNSLEPLTDSARLMIQTRVNELASQFFGLVSTARGLSPEQVRALEGASFLGREAVTAGLANGVATLDQVLSLAASAAASGASEMTDEEKAEMADLKARLAAAEQKIAAIDEEEAPAEDAPADAPADDEDEEETPAEASTEVADLKAELALLKITAAVDTASRAGKVEPAKRKEMIALGQQIGLASLKTVLDAIPAHAVASRSKSKASEASAAVTAMEASIAKTMGITPEQFAATKARIAATTED